jgi:hypothetical protein
VRSTDPLVQQFLDVLSVLAERAEQLRGAESTVDFPDGVDLIGEGVAQSLVQARDEHRAARTATQRLADRYQRSVAQEVSNYYIHLRDARVVASGLAHSRLGACTGAGGYRRSRDGPSDISRPSRQRRRVGAMRETSPGPGPCPATWSNINRSRTASSRPCCTTRSPGSPRPALSRPMTTGEGGAAGRAGLSRRRHPRPRFGLVAARAEHRRLDRRVRRLNGGRAGRRCWCRAAAGRVD